MSQTEESPAGEVPAGEAPAGEEAPQQSCQRPGCSGSYEDMGGGELYCDTCGLAPVVSASGMVNSPPTGITGGGRGSRGSGSSSARSSRTSARSSQSRRSVSGRLSRALSGRTTGRSVSVRSSGKTAGSSGRARLGVGLVQVPDVPRPDPRSMVLETAEVPERKRFCSRSDCGAPVGRARGERPGRTEGFCTKCGHPYSFVPKLHSGDIVRGQYEVVGCLAHGGLGWIYLAIDRAVSDRWVVLKGLLDTGDQDAMAAAISERRFLAEIEHSNIVRIYNFVEHLDQRTGSLDGYIVMEYVGGKSLKEIANDRRTADGRRDPLPVEQACAYGIEALEALGHLHSRNLLYCDFKVDNAIQTEDQLKLIDMGAVRRMDDDESAIYGTVGYQAPEVADVGPSVASDLYTVARTLAVLTFDFQGYTNVFVDSLPDPDTIEVFRQYESFYRLLVRATDPDPARRFASAQEMAEQLTGVLREVVSLQTGRARPALSTIFGPEVRVTDTELFAKLDGDVSRLGRRRDKASTRNGSSPSVGSSPSAPPALLTAGAAVPARLTRALDTAAAALALPVPRVDAGDPNAGFLAGLMTSAPTELITALHAAPSGSLELRLRELRARLEMGEFTIALATLDALERDHPDDWRVVWYRGVAALATGDHENAALSFDAIYDAFPGEPAPKLALGLCAEVLGQLDNAAEYYRLVWTTDPSFVSSAFGLARVRLTAGDRQNAVHTLESVPEASIHYTAARVAAVRARLRHRPEATLGAVSAPPPAGAAGNAEAAPDVPFLDDLTAAAGQIEALGGYGLDAVRREQLSTEVLGCALDWVLSGSQGAAPPAGERMLLGSALDERGLRFGLERSYRTLARLAPGGEERIDLVERANRYRPRTWV
ncbi:MULTISPECIES: serine/threonine-protein kinase [Streptomyces]|uniref:non-specific serine/threonine protein kinase n=1 Tax=Streptomyces stelliscabiei TaxID=146820 RepID=A0A8I0P4J4_9ACTN|nr:MULTISPECIES: serine/threonine-protein kinase [Streptomyces]KND45530.1 serine/threonine protein kinase [Streptomyces stelliscabiei]MBE1597357.1 serine/threonine-protein kinase PknG [Streptomyces stelliscabiei]MDX2513711.1 serine/threonine protein kinase [Streptomyces stelliscabiei]MDX2549982.1 serine/threonine protein kinase [Streptomyces stelliscabiei]MDX2610598.1 serine/threonine protein kinase [Streptomyces stelliscabiei]